MLRAGVFCQFLLLRFRGGPPALPERGLPLTMTGGGDGGDGGPGGQGGGGAVLQALPLTPGDNDTGDTISDGHVGPDPDEPKVMFYSFSSIELLILCLFNLNFFNVCSIITHV